MSDPIENILDEGPEQKHVMKLDKDHPLDVDEEKLSRANRVFHRYFLQLFLALLYTFNAGNYTGTITEVLGTTGHFKNPFKSLERIVTTFVHYLEWHTDDPKRMSRSLKKIHAIHTAVNENAAKRHGISIAKHDMMVAQFMFLGPVFLFPERVGIHGLSDADLEVLAYHHFVVGRSQGIRDDVNLYGGNLEEIRAHCWDVHMKTIKPEFGNPDPESVALGRNFCEGASMFNRFLFPAKVVMATTQNIFDVDSSKTVSEMTLVERAVFSGTEFLLRTVLWVPLLGRLLQVLFIHPFLRWNFSSSVAHIEKELGGQKLYQHY